MAAEKCFDICRGSAVEGRRDKTPCRVYWNSESQADNDSPELSISGMHIPVVGF
jgi:hypothetical protein